MLSRLPKFFLVATSLSPVFLTLAFLDWRAGEPLRALFWLTATLSLIVLTRLLLTACRRKLEQHRVELQTARNSDREVMGFLLAYVLPLALTSGTSITVDGWAVLFLVILFGIVVWGTQAYDFNPLLGLIGYHFFEVETHDGITYVLISRKAIVLREAGSLSCSAHGLRAAGPGRMTNKRKDSWNICSPCLGPRRQARRSGDCRCTSGYSPRSEELFQEQATRFMRDKEVLPFDPGHNAETDELFSLSLPALAREFDALEKRSLAYEVLPIDDAALMHTVGFVVRTTVLGRKRSCFQVFDRRQALTRDRITILSLGNGLSRLQESGFVLSNDVAAVLDSEALYFHSFHVVSRLFNLGEHFHEATKAEVEAFVGHDMFEVADAAGLQVACESTRVRKQIALVLQSEVLRDVPISRIQSEARRMGHDFIKISKGRIRLPSDRVELKKVLDFLMENYYEGCLTTRSFVTNSKRPADRVSRKRHARAP